MSRESILNKMKSAFENTMPSEIDHAFNVLKNAEIIMDGENIEGRERYLITATALIHDIGMINAKAKYNNTSGFYQEKEGPAAARKLLDGEDLSRYEISRICYIIGHHHTFGAIDDMDFQIIWEADILEALKKVYQDRTQDKLRSIINKNFKTKTGYKLAEKTLGLVD